MEVRGSSGSQWWFMNKQMSKHVTRKIENFFFLKALKGGGVLFNDGKKGYFFWGRHVWEIYGAHYLGYVLCQ